MDDRERPARADYDPELPVSVRILDQSGYLVIASGCKLSTLTEALQLRGMKAADDRGPDYQAAWKALSEPLSWMQGNPQLNAYLGWNLADIANDLIDRAYPNLRPKADRS